MIVQLECNLRAVVVPLYYSSFKNQTFSVDLSCSSVDHFSRIPVVVVVVATPRMTSPSLPPPLPLQPSLPLPPPIRRQDPVSGDIENLSLCGIRDFRTRDRIHQGEPLVVEEAVTAVAAVAVGIGISRTLRAKNPGWYFAIQLSTFQT